MNGQLTLDQYQKSQSEKAMAELSKVRQESLEEMKFNESLRQSVLDNRLYTPDLPYLNLYFNHYVFVYGTLKEGCSRSDLLRGNPKNVYCGAGMSVGSEFDLLYYPAGGFPIVFERTGSANRSLKLKGEVWSVPPETVVQLDRMECQGGLFSREKRAVYVGSQTLWCHVYIGIKTFWNTVDLYDLPVVQETNKPHKKYHSYLKTIGDRYDKAYENEQRKKLPSEGVLLN